MSELFDLFSAPVDPSVTKEPSPQMTPEQRSEIRALFSALGITTAQEQFDLVSVLVGVKLRAVSDLDSKSAAALVPRLQKRLETRSKSATGNSWNDRDEDTWIDNL